MPCEYFHASWQRPPPPQSFAGNRVAYSSVSLNQRPLFQDTLLVIGEHHAILVTTTVAKRGQFLSGYFIIF
jgi:hypothetical protein